MNEMRRDLIAAVLLAFASLGGCVLPIDTPAGYVPLRDTGDKDFLAISARGNTLAVTEGGNEGGRPADLSFWAEAFKHEKVELGRYRLKSEQEIRTAAGREGRLLDLRLGQGAAEYTWLVALFVDPSRIVTVEACGPTSQLDPDRDKILASVRTLRR